MAEPYDPIDSYDPILPEDPVLAEVPELPIESDEPVRSKSSIPPPLPRLWKSPPEAEEVVDSGASKSKKKVEVQSPPPRKEKPRPPKKKKVEAPVDDGTGAVKLEETPVLDTYEARQRARWLVGGLLGAIGAIALIIIWNAFRGDGTEEIREGEPPAVHVTSNAAPNNEIPARNMLETAKNSHKAGKIDVAVTLLTKLTKTYPGTAASREAAHALERNRQNKSLFGVDALEQATKPNSPNSARPLPTAPSPPKSVATTKEGALTQPNNPDLTSKAAPATVTPPAPPIVFKPLPRGYRPVPDAPIHSSGWPTRILCELDGGELVLVPGGTFLMGREDGEANERPAHPVTLSTYYIDRHEVTVRQFVQFLKETKRPFDAAKLAPRETTDPPTRDEYPVVNVSAREAKEFCSWAHRRLPTEAQWEMAARSPGGLISFWSGELPRKDPPKGPRLMEPVMSLPSDLSAYGAYDMAANAWEWTSEYFDSQYYQQFRAPVTDPTGPKESKAKLALVTVKGGSKLGVLTWREGQKIETRLPYLGFRGALPVEGAPASTAPATAPSSKQSSGGVVPF
jgi:formylglycine-generating enzyme